MNNENSHVVLDLTHNQSSQGAAQQMVTRLLGEARISEILDSLGEASSVEIRFKH